MPAAGSPLPFALAACLAMAAPLTAGAAKLVLKGETETDQMSGFIFGVAKNIAVKPVLAVLKASGRPSLKWVR